MQTFIIGIGKNNDHAGIMHKIQSWCFFERNREGKLKRLWKMKKEGKKEFFKVSYDVILSALTTEKI